MIAESEAEVGAFLFLPAVEYGARLVLGRTEYITPRSRLGMGTFGHGDVGTQRVRAIAAEYSMRGYRLAAEACQCDRRLRVSVVSVSLIPLSGAEKNATRRVLFYCLYEVSAQRVPNRAGQCYEGFSARTDTPYQQSHRYIPSVHPHRYIVSY